MSKRKLLPGLLLSALLLIIVSYRLDFETLWESFRSVEPFPLLVAAVVSTLTLGIRTWRWQYLLEPVKRIRIMPLLSVTSIGAMTDMLLPARAGDIVRAYQIGRRERISKITSLASLVLEKLLDVLTIAAAAIVLFIGIGLSPNAFSLPPEFQTGLLITVIIGAVSLAALWLTSRNTARFLRMFDVVLSRLPDRLSERFQQMFQSFVDGIQAIRGGGHTGRIVVLSILLWSAFALNNYLIIFAFGLKLPAYAAILVLVFQVIGVTLPSSPGAIGTYHAAVLIGLAIFGVSREQALSVAILMHGAFFFPFLVVGFLFLWHENISFKNLWAASLETTEG